MARLVRNPQELLDQLRRLVTPPAPAGRNEPTSVDRILDAAHEAFSASGIRATTMTRIARDASVSREWLYRQFANRDAIVVAVAQREVVRFIDGLAVRAFGADDLDSAMIETFVYSVEFLRDHELLQRVLHTEADVLTGRVLQEGAPTLGVAVQAGAGYLSALGDLRHDEAVTVAEVLVRLVATITFAPTAVLDLHDAEQLRRFATTVVPGVIASARTAAPLEPPKARGRTSARTTA
jgi:AcrR family transcriptional regulator